MFGGFMDYETATDAFRLVATKPSFAVGEAFSLATRDRHAAATTTTTTSSTSTPATVWTIDSNNNNDNNDDDDDDDDLVDDDDLLEEEDLKVPDRDKYDECGRPTKKACKNCSCGLADEQEEEIRQAAVKIDLDTDTDDGGSGSSSSKKEDEKRQMPKSACGSCYLGDAFRCSTCPYFGAPAFKPGDKITLDL